MASGQSDPTNRGCDDSKDREGAVNLHTIHVDDHHLVRAVIRDLDHGKGHVRGWIWLQGRRFVVVQNGETWYVEREYNPLVQYHRDFKKSYGWPI